MVNSHIRDIPAGPGALSTRGLFVVATVMVLAAGAVLMSGRSCDRAAGTPPALVGLRIDVNSANAAELAMLEGIGPTLAQRIMEHRAEHGPFESVDQLDDVAGIGPKKIERLRGEAEVALPAR